ncbi:MAG: epoxyqueuosine reductase [Chloroflexi bacterium]|nr:epoxyqueuosine reductase [Chloroflexota bacterium]
MSTRVTVTSRDIEDYVKKMVRESEKNRLVAIDNSPIYDEPLVGFANGDDPIFWQYKTIIGPFHYAPGEILERATRDKDKAAAIRVKYANPHGHTLDSPGVRPEKISVISWVLPYTEENKAAMRRETRVPPKRWAHARSYGSKFGDFLREQVVEFLQGKGYAAVAPFLTPFFEILVSPDDRRSDWSEKHVAYACGLGTFSLASTLITPKGMSMRLGSVVTDLDLPASPRTYASHFANCPYLVNGSCGECIERCPAGAISARGIDKTKCLDHRGGAEFKPVLKRYGVETLGCAFCQTGVACESRIPAEMLQKRS